MKRLTIILAAAALYCGTSMQAQTGTGGAPAIKHAYESVKNNILRSAEKIPDEDYNFKPTSEIRSLGEVLNHVTAAQTRTCGALLGEHQNISAEANTKSAILNALRESFSECDRAYDSVTDANLFQSIETPHGQMSRLAILVGNAMHDEEQYGILSVYMRLKGITPPSSEHPASR
ncbi:MAG: DinB family protein [Acidobacteriaceae bacterium]|nr:DinB family protein [Acidobacteriaceae bacterium]